MLTNKDIILPYYSGNIRFSKCLGFVTLNDYINSIKNPSDRTKLLLHNIAKAVNKNDKQLKRRLKHGLFSFTPTVIILKGVKRTYMNIHDWNPLMQIDLDGLPSRDKAVELKEHIFEHNKQIVCAMVSPSGKGVKCLMRIKKPKSIEHYKAMHKSMISHFEMYDYIDTATNNAVLPLFLGADDKILYRDFNDCEEWVEADWTKINYVQLLDIPTHQLQEVSKYTKLVENILKKRFREITDNGHTQLRSASLILGSRISAGYIDEQEAKELLISLVQSNTYFHKGLEGYIDTALWAVNEGMKQPKYF